MGIDTWLTQWKPGDLSITVLVFISFVMFWLRVWPWLTTVYFPSRERRQDRMLELEAARDQNTTKALVDIHDALIELKSQSRQQTDLIERFAPRPIRRDTPATAPRKKKLERVAA